jgi:hypothetical protein
MQDGLHSSSSTLGELMYFSNALGKKQTGLKSKSHVLPSPSLLSTTLFDEVSHLFCRSLL